MFWWPRMISGLDEGQTFFLQFHFQPVVVSFIVDLQRIIHPRPELPGLFTLKVNTA
jgi:hypothetical protein